MHGIGQVVHAHHGFLPHRAVPERKAPGPRPIGGRSGAVDGFEHVTPLRIEADVQAHVRPEKGAMRHEVRGGRFEHVAGGVAFVKEQVHGRAAGRCRQVTEVAP